MEALAMTSEGGGWLGGKKAAGRVAPLTFICSAWIASHLDCFSSLDNLPIELRDTLISLLSKVRTPSLILNDLKINLHIGLIFYYNYVGRSFE